MAKTGIDISTLTPFRDVNDILLFYTSGIKNIFRKRLVGIYLTGSLSYQAFNYQSSDIDTTVILQSAVSSGDLSAIRNFHKNIEHKFKKWSKRFECSYTRIGMLQDILPPKEPRPWYWGEGSILYEEAPYGNEWIINNYLLYHYAIPLFGPEFKELINPIDITEVQKASIRDLFTEWEIKKWDRLWFKNSHYESYFILNLCRILYTVTCRAVGSKKSAAAWVKSEYGNPWDELIIKAESWKYGAEMNMQKQAIKFLDFVIDQISKTELYFQLIDEINKIRSSSYRS